MTKIVERKNSNFNYSSIEIILSLPKTTNQLSKYVNKLTIISHIKAKRRKNQTNLTLHRDTYFLHFGFFPRLGSSRMKTAVTKNCGSTRLDFRTQIIFGLIQRRPVNKTLGIGLQGFIRYGRAILVIFFAAHLARLRARNRLLRKPELETVSLHTTKQFSKTTSYSNSGPNYRNFVAYGRAMKTIPFDS